MLGTNPAFFLTLYQEWEIPPIDIDISIEEIHKNIESEIPIKKNIQSNAQRVRWICSHYASENPIWRS